MRQYASSAAFRFAVSSIAYLRSGTALQVGDDEALVDHYVAANEHIAAVSTPISIAEARAQGKVRQEGKDYVLADGDVVDFKFYV